MLKKDYSKTKYQHPLKVKDKKDKKPSKARKIITASLVIFLLLTAVYILFFSPWLNINKIQIKGTNNAEYNIIANQWLEARAGDKALKYIPGNNFLLLTTKELKNLLEEDKYINSAVITKKFPNKLLIKIGERQAKLIYAYENKNYLIDEQGNFIEQIILNENINLPIILGTTTDRIITPPLAAGGNARTGGFDPQLINFISNLTIELPKYIKNVNIINFQLIPKTTEIIAQTSANWKIYFNTSVDLMVQLSNLSRTYYEKISDKEKPNLNYIDVRLENYVYYK